MHLILALTSKNRHKVSAEEAMDPPAERWIFGRHITIDSTLNSTDAPPRRTSPLPRFSMILGWGVGDEEKG